MAAFVLQGAGRRNRRILEAWCGFCHSQLLIQTGGSAAVERGLLARNIEQYFTRFYLPMIRGRRGN